MLGFMTHERSRWSGGAWGDGRTDDCMVGPVQALATPPSTTAWERVERRREWVGDVSGVREGGVSGVSEGGVSGVGE